MSSKQFDNKMNKSQAGKQNDKYSKNTNTKRRNYEEEAPSYYMIPIFFILCIIPFIVRMKEYDPKISQYLWAPNVDSTIDYFLYYKHWFFIVVAAIMVAAIIAKAYKKNQSIRVLPTFIPLGLYVLMALLSAIFSKYRSFSFFGSFDQFESVFAILGYGIVTYYAFYFINKENDVKNLNYFIIGTALVMSVIGILQFSGHDLFATDFGYRLVTPPKYQVEGSRFVPNFGNSSYLTLYNPNYVGVYVSLITPIIAISVFYQKNKKSLIVSIIALIGILICGVGSQSLAGIVGLVIAGILICIFMWRYLVKRYLIVIGSVIVLIVVIIITNVATDNMLTNKLSEIIHSSNPKFELAAMDTNDDNVSLTYRGNKLYVQYLVGSDQGGAIIATDESGQIVPVSYNAETNIIQVTDERFTGISFGPDPENAGAFFIEAEGFRWSFTNMTEDRTYYHINRMGRLDKMITAPSAVFTGNEWFATARGYIWSRTIPTLKNSIILGTGPDTFFLTFPQQDYINFSRYGYGSGIMSKPHSLYLQIWSQTGLISLLAFLAFYLMYFIASFRLYIKGRFNNIYAQTGLAIFIGSFAYMVTGLTNDSSITTAPMFWLLVGTGIAMNQKAKPLIQEEEAMLKDDSHKK